MKTELQSCEPLESVQTRVPDAVNRARDASRRQLAKPLKSLARMVVRMTGLRLHVLWQDPREPEADWGGVWCPAARERQCARLGREPICLACSRFRWKPALAAEGEGKGFTGRCGARNFCISLPLQVGCWLTLMLQAPRSGRISSSALPDAMALLRLEVHDWKATAEARIAARKLEAACRALKLLQRKAMSGREPSTPAAPSLQDRVGPVFHCSHSGRIVAAMRDFVRQNYQHPLGLNEVAAAMHMNASYLSAVFSRTTGQKFRQFLENVRLAKARELLCDPRRRIREVADAAGYASPDAFRHAFKARAGLSPEAWRRAR